VIPASQAASRSRRRIGKYAVTGRIGRGGMGVVYRGRDEILEREVAIKTLTIEGILDEESRKRFEIEAKAAAKLQHPNIVTVFELGEERGVPFIAMELLSGTDLEGLLRGGEPMPLEEKLDVIVQVLRGLAFAHDHGVVHRDVKPSNVRILDDGSVKLVDFGIAKLGATSVTKSGMMVGTVHYMSPEQIRGQVLDGRSDVFSVGVILYELLTGRRPYTGDTATDVLYKIVHQAHPPLAVDLGASTARLQEVAERALAKHRENRYHASEMADELAEVLAAATRERAREAPAEDDDAVSLARGLLKEGRIEECVRCLQQVLRRAPHSLDAIRTLRVATREMRRQKTAEVDDFHELEATFQAPPTRRELETVQQPAPPPTQVEAEVPTPRPSRRLSRTAVTSTVAAGVLLGVAAVVLFRGGGPPPPTPLRIPVSSQPRGALVLVDGKPTGVVTDGELALVPPHPQQVVLTFRKEGHLDEVRTVQLPVRPGDSIGVTLAPVVPAGASARVQVTTEPPGATVVLDGRRLPGTTPLELEVDPARDHRLSLSLAGHAPQEVPIAARKAPAELRLTLVADGPPGTVAVTSAYPVDLTWRGSLVARGQRSPRLSLPQGRHVVTISAAEYFLRMNVTVEIRAGTESRVSVPGLGRLSIAANPDNCKILIDDAFADYPPIRERPVAAGAHTVSFLWPDGVRRQERIEVITDRHAFVTGRRN
jgi:predicted Ser/Thr protein kinase